MIRLSGWLLVAAIIVAVAVYAAGFITLPVLEAILGAIGVGGIAGLRLLINSSGYKTLILAAGGALSVVLYVLGVISQDVFATLFSGILGLSVAALGHAIYKTPDIGSALKR